MTRHNKNKDIEYNNPKLFELIVITGLLTNDINNVLTVATTNEQKSILNKALKELELLKLAITDTGFLHNNIGAAYNEWQCIFDKCKDIINATYLLHT